MRSVLTMTLSDLRQRARDRSVFIFALVVPLALMYVFNLVFGGLSDVELESTTVAVSAPQDDQLAAAVVSTLEQLDMMEVRLERVDESQVRVLAESGEAGLGLVVPRGFGAGVMDGSGPVVRAVEGDGAGLETDVLISVLQATLNRLSTGTVATLAGIELGLPPAELATVAQEAATGGPAITLLPGQTSSEQLDAAQSIVAGQAGLFLLFTVGFGVLGLVTEREQGTLARLRSMPMRPGRIVLAKGLVSFILGVVATTVLLTVGGWFFDVGFGSPVAVGVLIAAVVAATTSVMFVIARVARTAEQANIAQSITAIVLGVAGGAFFPIAASGALALLLDLNPVAAFTRGLGITAGGGGVADLGMPMLLLLGFTLVVGTVARLIPDRGTSL